MKLTILFKTLSSLRNIIQTLLAIIRGLIKGLFLYKIKLICSLKEDKKKLAVLVSSNSIMVFNKKKVEILLIARRKAA